MVERPLEDKRPLGPFIGSSGTSQPDPTFETLDDLPESPMLRKFVKRQAEFLNTDVREVMNSDTAKDYMKQLGVWEEAVQSNR